MVERRPIVLGANGGTRELPVGDRAIGGALTAVAASGAYTANPGELVLADATTGAFTVTLPATTVGAEVEVKKVDSSSNVVTVAAATGNTVGSAGAANVPLRLQDQAHRYQANGTNWIIGTGHVSLSTLDGRYTSASTVAAPAWAASTTYRVGDLVWQNSLLYRRKTAGTSGVSFDTTAWDLIGPAAASDSDAWIGYAATTLDLAVNGASTLGSNVTSYARVTRGSVTAVTKVAMQVYVSSGNISVAVYRNTGSGLTAAPGAQAATSGAVACPAVGFAQISLGGSVTVAPGDWFAFSADNTTARVGSVSTAPAAAAIGDTLAVYGSGHPAPASPGALSSLGRQFVLFGVA